MSIQTPIYLEPKMLNFADLFVDGCEVKFVQGASCNVRAALPDGSLVPGPRVAAGRPSRAASPFRSASGSRTGRAPGSFRPAFWAGSW